MKTRSETLSQLCGTVFDLAVLGGGIVGAGVAQNAAASGLKVLLIEKGDFASGTSSRTTKLMHGGFRYLEQYDFRLTRELCQERGLMERLAPHLVKDFTFMLPLERNRKLFGMKVGVGLTVYDLLSVNSRGRRLHKRLNLGDTLSKAPSLNKGRIRGSLLFHDCITDDSRIVLEVLKSAESLGALTLNYVEALDFQGSEGRIEAVRCLDRLSGEEIWIKCRACVNACGIWSDALLQKADRSWTPIVKPAKGTHIVLPMTAFKTDTALFLPTDDGRYVFAVPWQGALMVGTTDHDYDGPLDAPTASPAEVQYLLSVLNSYRALGPEANARELCPDDVIAAWAGCRPLVQSGGSTDGNTASLSREHLLFEGPHGIIGLVGGKLTNYRMLACHVVDAVLAKLVERDSGYGLISTARTDKIMLGGWTDQSDYEEFRVTVLQAAGQLQLSLPTAEHLLASYGKEALRVMEYIGRDPSLAELISEDFPAVMAELPYCLENEKAVTLEDILARRIRLAFINQKQCLTVLPRVASRLTEMGYWSEARAHRLQAEFQASLVKQQGYLP